MGLTREDILAGRLEALLQEEQRRGLADDLLCRAERRASRAALLAAFAPDEAIWLFGYGSLMWNPCIQYAERCQGVIYGYRRTFCLRSVMGRGTPDCCGLVLGLEPGGSCRGVAFRIERALAADELDIVWDREMLSWAYLPRIVTVYTADGPRRAITFVVNRDHPRYAGGLSVAQTAQMIATASGAIGSCAEYLFNTVAHLDAIGIADAALQNLKREVEAYQRLSTHLPTTPRS